MKCGVRYNYYSNHAHASRKSCRYNYQNEYPEQGYHMWSDSLF